MAILFRGVRLPIAVLCILPLLCSCAVKLISDYDEQIDSGLSQFNTELTIFVTKMTQAAGTPAGTYAQNMDFYTTQKAKLDTLILRAEAHKALNSCPSNALIKEVSARTVPPATGPPVGALSSTSLNAIAADLPDNDCSVLLLTQVRAGLGDVETFHKAQREKGIPASARDPILVGGLGSLIRVAITLEIAKKAAATKAGAK